MKDSRQISTESASRLSRYLTGLASAAAIVPSTQAAVVNIDVSSVSGINGGAAAGTRSFFAATWSADTNDGIWMMNGWVGPSGGTDTGLNGDAGVAIAAAGGYANPVKFAYGQSIGTGGNFTSSYFQSSFRDVYGGVPTNAPAWGAGSYLGFRDGDNHFGWLEVTWNPTNGQFQILSGAYESTPNTAINAGVTAVPEPGSLALLALGAVGALRRRRA